MILVSKSPRRADLLKRAGFDFTIVPPEWEENIPEKIPIEKIPVELATKKLLSVENKYPGELLLSADTIVVSGEEILNKPVDQADAVRMLRKLSGNWHRVISGIAIRKGGFFYSDNDISEVKFKALSPDEIEYYVNEYKPFDKAGAYGIQEWIGLIGITAINGSFYNVMGLPVHKVYETVKLLKV